MAMIAPDTADVLGQDAHAVRAIGHRRGEPQEQQNRECEERSASSDDVQRAGDEAGAGKEGEFEDERHRRRS